jgi:hypothetical protein
MTTVASGFTAAGIDSHLQANIIGAMLRTRHRTIAVDEAPADEVFHVTLLRARARSFFACPAKAAASAAGRPGRADTAARIDGATRAAVEIHA